MPSEDGGVSADRHLVPVVDIMGGPCDVPLCEEPTCHIVTWFAVQARDLREPVTVAVCAAHKDWTDVRPGVGATQ